MNGNRRSTQIDADAINSIPLDLRSSAFIGGFKLPHLLGALRVLAGCLGIVAVDASVGRRLCGLGNPCLSRKKLGSDLSLGVDTDDGNAFKATLFGLCLAETAAAPTSPPSAN